jgi:hypothetical protein
MSAEGVPIIGKFLTDNEILNVGSVVEFSSYQAKVVSCTLSPCMDENNNAFAVYVSAEVPHLVKTWKISYSTIRDLDRGRMKSYDGSLCLYEGLLMLKNAKGDRVGFRPKEKNDIFSLGAKLLFPKHVVRMGLPTFTPSTTEAKGPLDARSDGSSSSGASLKVDPLQQQDDILCETASKDDGRCHSHFSDDHGALSPGFSFSHGRNFAKDVLAKFQSTVAPSDESGHFMMVVSFGRSAFKIEEWSASVALEAAIGGQCDNLKVSELSERVFSFCVASKEVGFHILKLRKFACAQFKCFFHLWGRGGPNWKWEFLQWEKKLMNSGQWSVHLELWQTKG